MTTGPSDPGVRTDNLVATEPPPGPRLPYPVQALLFALFRSYWLPRLRRRHGDVVRLRIYPRRHAVELADLDHIRAVFAGSPEHFHAGKGNTILRPAMGDDSVFVLDEEAHRRLRALVMPAFNGAALRGYRDLVTEIAVDEARRWPSHGTVGGLGRMRTVTLEIILRVIFGVGEGERLDALRPLLARLADIGPVTLLGWYNRTLRRLGPTRHYARTQEAVDALLYAEMAQRRSAPDLDTRTDVLSRLLTITDGTDRLSDVEVRDQLVTLLLAGHETTATALAWALYELAHNPDVHATATEAADAGGRTGEQYLEAVLKESLRRRPVVSEVVRRLRRDIEVGGYRIAEGDVVMPSMTLVHADPAHHDRPDAFRPERFLDGGPASGSWFPFGGGVRRCLGAGFSLLEGTIVLRELLVRYRLAPAGLRRERMKARHITHVPAHGVRLRVQRRERR